QPVDRVSAGGRGLGLVFLPVARFDAEASPVQAATLSRLLVDVARAVAAPTLEGEHERLGFGLPEEGARAHGGPRLFRGPSDPAHQAVPAFEVAVAGVVARPFAAQRHRIRQVPLLK